MKKELWVIDMDDTLFTSHGFVNLYKNDENGEEYIWERIDSRDFDFSNMPPLDLNDGYRVCFDFFKDTEAFIESAKLVGKNWERIWEAGAKNHHRLILTARETFNDQKGFEKFVRGVLKDPQLVITCCRYCQTNFSPPLAKQEEVRKLLQRGIYQTVHMYDDSVPNLEAFKALKSEFPDIEFVAVKVNGEEFVNV